MGVKLEAVGGELGGDVLAVGVGRQAYGEPGRGGGGGEDLGRRVVVGDGGAVGHRLEERAALCGGEGEAEDAGDRRGDVDVAGGERGLEAGLEVGAGGGEDVVDG